MNKERNVPYLPLLFALLLLTGIFIGTRIGTDNTRKGLFSRESRFNKINDLINYVKDSYVDTVNDLQLYDGAINGLLQQLDPHSSYIPAADFHDVMDPLRGNFEGIGVQFRIVSDSIVIMNTIPGGPSAKAGLKAGDRIVRVDGKKILSEKITDAEVIKHLKGPKGSKVMLGIFRRGTPGLISFTVTRDVIPTYSVDAAYIIEPGTGYIKISRFSATTSKEVTEAIMDLLDQGMKSLILDLRDNTGGYLQSAIDLAKEFLPEKSMIVYTEGRKRPRQSYYADRRGLFQQGQLIVLIDEGSASASEILAGAVQDNDRGLIIGRRSFGKGLVQEELDFKDGSAVRLTVARYYTPTGRCIQRPYDKNHRDYEMEPMKRFLEEGAHPDSIHFPDSLKYKTPKGKIVYGGGGIMPDLSIPLEKNDAANVLHTLINNGTLVQFAFEFTDRNRPYLATFTDYKKYDTGFIVSDKILKEFIDFAAKKGTAFNDQSLQKSKEEIKSYLKSLIARDIFDDKGFYPIYNKTDKTIQKALEVLKK
ncbi:MAG: S41 family peptidase [Bacteroidales bacterium]